LSIFWNVKEKEKKSEDGATLSSGIPVIIDESKKINNKLTHIIKDNDAEIESATIRNDILLEISTFLARRWSNINDVTVVISRGRKTSTNIEKKRK